jgi:alpha-mannosidase
MVKKFILVFKTHFDIGFTNLSSKVIDEYADSMLRDVIITCKATQHMEKQKYVWTMPSWPLKIMIERCNSDLKRELDSLINNGQIVWHALPFTSHTDFCSAENVIEGLRYGHELSRAYNKPDPISAKMTDVPGHGIMLPAILSGAGVRFLHLGCNEFSTPPKVPFLFQWQAPSGESVLTMYSKGGYGTSLLPPEDWDYPVWMALMHTHDNSGPQSAEVIDKMVRTILDEYPDAEVICGTMDDFYRELSKSDLSNVPMITKDLADSWIHGIGAYPLEVGVIREEREKSKRLQAIYAKQIIEGSKVISEEIEKKQDCYYQAVNLFEEHTWGADVKTWLGPNRVYQKNDFIETKKQDNYRFMEASWQEQKDRAAQSSSVMCELKILLEDGESDNISVFNPNITAYTGWVSLKELSGMNWRAKAPAEIKKFSDCGLAIKGKRLPMTKIYDEWACYVEEIPPLVTVSLQFTEASQQTENVTIKCINSVVTVENHRYLLRFSESTGDIIELYDKKLAAVLLSKKNEKAVFSYRYDRYGTEDITSFLKKYAYRFSDWGIKDFGRENYPECEHRTYHPIYQSYSVDKDTVTFLYQTEDSAEKYGDAKGIRLEVTLPPAGEELFVSLHLDNKNETPYVEAGTFLFPFAQEDAGYRINKSNVTIDPSTDIQEGANHIFYCLENHITMMGEQNGLCIIAKDTPLVSLGDTGVLDYKKDYNKPKDSVACFNLFNNMWGTNFPQWIGGNLSYRYMLFGIEKAQEEAVMERAAILTEGVELTGNILAKDLVRFPEHMQLINVRYKNEGLILRFKELAGKEALRRIYAKGYNITPIDLKNTVPGEGCSENLEFHVKPYGIYSFQITKRSM